MAEARSASSRTFRVADFEERDDSWIFVLKAWRKSIIRKILRAWYVAVKSMCHVVAVGELT